MLAKIAPRFVISRVIHNAYQAQATAIDLLKQPLKSPYDSYQIHDSKHFFETRFYAYISTLQRPNNFVNQFESRAYDEACKKFALFNEIKALVDELNQVTDEAFTLYNQIERGTTNSNILSKKFETDSSFEADILDGIERFQKLEENLQAYPEWRNKVSEEIGHWYHMIHNNLSESQVKRKIFLKMNRQQYFV